MKNIFYILFTLILLADLKIQAQSYYQREYSQFIGRTEQVLLPNEDLILAGTQYINGQAGIPLIRVNQCGSTIWSIRLSDATKDIELIDLKMDNAQNLFLAGHYYMRSGERNIFLAEINLNGQVQFFKVFDSGTADILYSMDISVNNEIFLYFKTNIGQAGPVSINTVANFDNSGNLNWLKEYGFTAVWGQLTASSDGGFFIAEGRMLQKFNRAGNSEWAKQFNRPMYSQDNIQVGNNLIIFRYPQATSGFSAVTSVNLNGDINWHSRLIPNYRPYRGIQRANGKLLFIGKLNQGSVLYHPLLLEVDTANGDLIKSIVHKESIPDITPHDLDELADSSIIYSGYETRNTFGKTIVSRIDKELERKTCKDTSLNFSTRRDSATFLSYSPWLNSLGNIPIINPNIDSDPFQFGTNQLVCNYNFPQSLSLGNDTTLCPGVIWRYGVSEIFDGFTWNGPSSGREIRATEAGTYTLTAWQKCDTISDQIDIDYHQISSIDLGPDTSICIGDTIELSTGKGKSAIWSTGDTAIGIEVSNSGIYYAVISSICGPVSDTISVDQIPELKLELGEDTLICKGESIELMVGESAEQILWSTGSTAQEVELNSPGTYWVEIANRCKSLNDTLMLGFHPPTIPIIQLQEKVAEVYDSVIFRLLKPANVQQINWLFGDGQRGSSRNEFKIYSEAGQYEVSLLFTDSLGCQIDSSFAVEILPSLITVPNVFTPNNDGINDNFNLKIKGLERIELQVFNRWGKLVYRGLSNLWDGKDQTGKHLMAGTYFYSITYQQRDREVKNIQGSVTIID